MSKSFLSLPKFYLLKLSALHILKISLHLNLKNEEEILRLNTCQWSSFPSYNKITLDLNEPYFALKSLYSSLFRSVKPAPLPKIFIFSCPFSFFLFLGSHYKEVSRSRNWHGKMLKTVSAFSSPENSTRPRCWVHMGLKLKSCYIIIPNDLFTKYMNISAKCLFHIGFT